MMVHSGERGLAGGACNDSIRAHSSRILSFRILRQSRSALHAAHSVYTRCAGAEHSGRGDADSLAAPIVCKRLEMTAFAHAAPCAVFGRGRIVYDSRVSTSAIRCANLERCAARVALENGRAAECGTQHRHLLLYSLFLALIRCRPLLVIVPASSSVVPVTLILRDPAQRSAVAHETLGELENRTVREGAIVRRDVLDKLARVVRNQTYKLLAFLLCRFLHSASVFSVLTGRI